MDDQMRQVFDELERKSLPTSAWNLQEGAQRCGRAERFLGANAGKILRKLRGAASTEDAADVVAEITVALDLLTGPVEDVRYEPDRKGPDLTAVVRNKPEVHIEVKRIREPELTKRIRAWEARLRGAVRETPGSVSVSVRAAGFSASVTLGDNRRDEIGAFVGRLEAAEEALHAWLRQTLRRLDTELALGESREDSGSPLGREVMFEFDRHASATQSGNCYVSSNGGPLPYLGREHLKFSDAIKEKLRQLVPGESNVVAVVSDSTTHEPVDLREGIRALARQICEVPKRVVTDAGFASAAEFDLRVRSLSAVVFLSSCGPSFGAENRPPNELWLQSDALRPLGADLAAHLGCMRPPWVKGR